MTRLARPGWVDYASAELRAGWADGRRATGKPSDGRRYGGRRYAAAYAVGAMLRTAAAGRMHP